jgi:hypothetical protein
MFIADPDRKAKEIGVESETPLFRHQIDQIYPKSPFRKQREKG